MMIKLILANRVSKYKDYQSFKRFPTIHYHSLKDIRQILNIFIIYLEKQYIKKGEN